ncbi:MAG TPA: type II secretion system protein GspG [Blastocatellia bacterium]|nr:type II secretion system protein GspG [Blastocatellia bacterium]
MATQEQDERACPQCGERLAPDLRYCVHCYAPVAGPVSARAHVELASRITTTHRLDPTLIFSPEKHEQLARRARSRRRMMITAAGVLTTVVAVSITLNLLAGHRQRVAKAMAREDAAWRDLNTLADALERFRGDVARYPTNEEGLRSLARRPAAFPPDGAEQATYWFGPYMENVPEVDPWGNDYLYTTTDGGGSFELFSYGPGGETSSDSRFRVASRVAATDR